MRSRRLPLTVMPIGRVWGTGIGMACTHVAEDTSSSATSCSTAAAKLSQPIAVLQGPDNGSSGEATVLAFRGLGHARSFGAPTAGYSSANQVRSLYDGTQILITTAVDVDRTGKTWNGGPVPPEQSADVDTAHKTAATWLNTQCHR